VLDSILQLLRQLLPQIWQQIADEGLHAILEAILMGVVGLVTALLVRALVRRGKVWVGANAGRTCISPRLLVFSVLAAVIAVVALAGGLIFRQTLAEPGDFYAWVALVVAMALASLVLVALSRHTWEWDAAGLVWHGAWSSRAMRWADLVRIGRMANGQLYVVDRAGRRIAWSTRHTLRHEALLRAVRAARPDLPLPA
jgi:hypothetical protein